MTRATSLRRIADLMKHVISKLKSVSHVETLNSRNYISHLDDHRSSEACKIEIAVCPHIRRVFHMDVVDK